MNLIFFDTISNMLMMPNASVKRSFRRIGLSRKKEEMLMKEGKTVKYHWIYMPCTTRVYVKITRNDSFEEVNRIEFMGNQIVGQWKNCNNLVIDN